MKKIIYIFVLALAVMLPTQTFAQTPKQRQTREQLALAQARHIAHNLALDDKTTALFVDTYCDCQKEIWTVAPRKRGSSATSDADSERAIKAHFEKSEKLLEIRQKYYKKYSAFLTQRQIQRVYEIEKQMKQRLFQKHKRIPHRS